MGRKFWVMVGPEQEERSGGNYVKEDETPARFVGVQVPGAEAERSGLIDMLLRCHYTRSEVDGIIDAHVKASDGEPDYTWRIIEISTGYAGWWGLRSSVVSYTGFYGVLAQLRFCRSCHSILSPLMVCDCSLVERLWFFLARIKV
ncbi:hypothetical protein OIU77_026370 [Salix suchowensis]|uniref:Uncharacterized protein n=1 Tax=Salix suchowensis TaxID=1278906 RepID=A0ABQ9BNB6_9ROSI|nr:hypothetical protein OIU77_026370 [Salix suchowensis]